MNKNLLHNDVQSFINTNLKTDIQGLILKGSPFPDIKIQELANQIISKSKCRNKLPSWFLTEGVYYPKPINIEQTSSEITAQYKAHLVTGKTLADLTGGFGVDSFFLSHKVEQLTYCEIDTELSAIAAYNFNVLGLNHINCLPEDGIAFLQSTRRKFDWLFIDPSRRTDVKGKVFILNDCLPNVVVHLDLLLSKSKNILIKLSPILDVQSVISDLNFVKEIHVVSSLNDVKELLIILEKDYNGPIKIKTVNFNKTGEDIFEAVFHSCVSANFSSPKTYLYEPNSAILKAGLFNEISHQLNVFKLHANSHLYTSDKLIYFPGRKFKIISCLKYKPKEMKQKFLIKKANITTRNFHETVAQIRKRTKIKEGGSDYLFFTTGPENQALLIHCEKV